MRLRARITSPSPSKWDVLPLDWLSWSQSPTAMQLKPMRVDQNANASMQDPQDSSVPPVTTVRPATETTPWGNTTTSDLGSYLTDGAAASRAEGSSCSSFLVGMVGPAPFADQLLRFHSCIRNVDDVMKFTPCVRLLFRLDKLKQENLISTSLHHVHECSGFTAI